MRVAIIGVPYQLDEPYVGMGRAPDALLDAGLAQRLQELGCETILVEMVDIPESTAPREERLGQLAARLGYEVARARAASFFPLVLGGDCLCALGTLAGLLTAPTTGVAWLDAHGDFNTPATTPSGYLGGMPLACAAGRGLESLRQQCRLSEPVAESNIVLLGARDLDPLEEQALAGSEVLLVPGPELQAQGQALEQALQRLAGASQFYLHLDIDVLDPHEAPGIDYPAPGGLRREQLAMVVERLAALPNLAALALTAVNPDKDSSGRTVQVALEMIEAAIRPLVAGAQRRTTAA